MDRAVLRGDMVEGVEHALDELDETVAEAMGTVPRHEFVPEHPYDNRPGAAQGTRILSPTVVARLLDAVGAEPGEDLLVVGAGVGYTPAVLAEICGGRHVHAVDVAREVVLEARQNLSRAGYDAVLVDCRDGADGLPAYAPFDRILLEAAAARPPAALLDQLRADGRLVMPAGTGEQTLVSVRPSTDGGGHEVLDRHGPVEFRPLLVDGERDRDIPRNRTVREDREFARQSQRARSGWEYDWIDWEG